MTSEAERDVVLVDVADRIAVITLNRPDKRNALNRAVRKALPAAITSVFLARRWLTRGPGRSLRVADGYDDNVEKWLAS